ncbi:MAG: DinB family protein [Gemmatimonadota bacterium]|nr:DinB family protein [Gemmatimonadota bacterium]
MAALSLSRPDPSEYGSFYEGYVARATGDVFELLGEQRSEIEALRSLSAAQALHRYEPGKWSVKEVIGHMHDAELVFAYRMLRIARGDTTPLAGFDQQPYVDNAHFDRVSLDDLVDGLLTARAATLSLANQLDEGAWARTGVASGFAVSARAIVFIIAGHTSHHLHILRDRYGLRA